MRPHYRPWSPARKPRPFGVTFTSESRAIRFESKTWEHEREQARQAYRFSLSHYSCTARTSLLTDLELQRRTSTDSSQTVFESCGGAGGSGSGDDHTLSDERLRKKAGLPCGNYRT